MKRYVTILFYAVALTCMTLTAHAQAQRTFVSTSGNDVNTASLCSTTSPCRSFTAAQTVTTAGGEIVALTSGGYGPVDITKSIQLTSPLGVYAAITALPATAIGGTDAIRVSAGANDTVAIRGLTLNNVGTVNANGITFPSGGRLYVENCVINGFDNQGIRVVRTTAADPELFVTDTIIRNGSNVEDLDAGILLQGTSGSGAIRATVTNCQLERAGNVGLFAAGRARVNVRNTVSSRNRHGFIAAADSGTSSRLHLENSTATHNLDDGIVVGDFFPISGGPASARISNTASGNNNDDGIYVTSNGTAHISDSHMNGNAGTGIFVHDPNVPASPAIAYISGSTVNDNAGDGVDVLGGETAYISDSTINGNEDDGVDVSTGGTAHISDSTISKNTSDGIELSNDATSVVYVTFTTINGNGAKGLNRGGGVASVATTIGSNRIFNNTGGSDSFSSAIAQQ